MKKRSRKNSELEKIKEELKKVKAELRAAGKEWFALESIEKIKGEYRVWLNPKERDIHCLGYFTLAELRAWAKSKGPVMWKNTIS